MGAGHKDLTKSHTVYALIPEDFVPFASFYFTILKPEDEQSSVTSIGKDETRPVLRLEGLSGKVWLDTKRILLEQCRREPMVTHVKKGGRAWMLGNRNPLKRGLRWTAVLRDHETYLRECGASEGTCLQRTPASLYYAVVGSSRELSFQTLSWV